MSTKYQALSWILPFEPTVLYPRPSLASESALSQLDAVVPSTARLWVFSLPAAHPQNPPPCQIYWWVWPSCPSECWIACRGHLLHQKETWSCEHYNRNTEKMFGIQDVWFHSFCCHEWGNGSQVIKLFFYRNWHNAVDR